MHRANPGKSFWHADVYHEFPPETRDYVPMVIAAAWLFLHPREYGLTLPEFDVRPAKLQLHRGDAFTRTCRAATVPSVSAVR